MATGFEQPKAKPANDAYTGMLAVSLFALLVGCAALYLDYAQYPDKPPTKVDISTRDRSSSPDWISAPDAAKATDEPPPTGDPKDVEPPKTDPDTKKGGRR